MVIEEITDDDISFYALYGDLYDKSFSDLDANPLVNTISPDIEFQMSDVIETATSSVKRSLRPANTTQSEDAARIKARELPRDALFEIGKIEGAVGFPFHLRWLNSLWAKNAWEGECKSLRICYAAAAANATRAGLSMSREYAHAWATADALRQTQFSTRPTISGMIR